MPGAPLWSSMPPLVTTLSTKKCHWLRCISDQSHELEKQKWSRYFYIIDHSESSLQFMECSESLKFIFKGWEKSVGIMVLVIHFLRVIILFSLSHRCTIQLAFPGHHTQFLVGIMAATPCQDYWLHHQVWEAWVPSQRSGPSAPPWCHRSYYYWYCCFHAVIIPYSLGHTKCLADSNCVFGAVPGEKEALFLITSKNIFCVGALGLNVSQKSWIRENAIISILS